MLRLLIFRGGPHGRSLNLIPFRTIAEYFVYLSDSSEYLSGMRRYALVNLVGNLALFVPLGVLLPALFPRLRKAVPFLLTVLAALLCVETIQYLLGVGAADVDDLLLNTLGALAGFAAAGRIRKPMV